MDRIMKKLSSYKSQEQSLILDDFKMTQSHLMRENKLCNSEKQYMTTENSPQKQISHSTNKIFNFCKYPINDYGNHTTQNSPSQRDLVERHAFAKSKETNRSKEMSTLTTLESPRKIKRSFPRDLGNLNNSSLFNFNPRSNRRNETVSSMIQSSIIQQQYIQQSSHQPIYNVQVKVLLPESRPDQIILNKSYTYNFKRRKNITQYNIERKRRVMTILPTQEIDSPVLKDIGKSQISINTVLQYPSKKTQPSQQSTLKSPLLSPVKPT